MISGSTSNENDSANKAADAAETTKANKAEANEATDEADAKANEADEANEDVKKGKYSRQIANRQRSRHQFRHHLFFVWMATILPHKILCNLLER